MMSGVVMQTRRLSGLLMPLVLCSCSLFTSYPRTMQPVRTEVAAGKPDQALRRFNASFRDESKKSSAGNPGHQSADTPDMLNALERGRLYQFLQAPEASRQQYATVIDHLKQQQLKARIQFSKLLENTGAIALNDKTLPYIVPDYAQTFLYTYQAINYLDKDQLSDALVAVRQLSEVQEWLTQQKQINKTAQHRLLSHQKETGYHGDEYTRAKPYQRMKKEVASLSNAYENAFAYYLAAILYQRWDNNFNNARVAINNAARVAPENQYVAQTRQEILRGFNGGNAYLSGKGRLVVLLEQGLVPPKQAFSFPLILPRLGIQRISLPVYPGPSRLPGTSLLVLHHNQQIADKAHPELLVNTRKMAIKALLEQYPVIVAREIMRVITKAGATYMLSRQQGGLGDWGWLIGSVYSLSTSGADLRSWLLLPDAVWLYENMLQAGTYQLDIGPQTTEVTIKPGKTHVLLINHIGTWWQVRHYQL